MKSDQLVYDEYGGIMEPVDPDAAAVPPTPSQRVHTAYSPLEKLLFRNNMRVQYASRGQDYKLDKLRIGLTNRCTARCVYCPRKQAHAAGSGYMDFSMYTDLIDWGAENGIRSLSYGGWGEPTLHPRLFDMLDYALDRNFAISISSNFLALDEEGIERLAEYPFYAFEMSMDGYTAEEYTRGKQVNRYARAKENILHYLSLARDRGSKTKYNIHFVDAGNVSFLNKFRYARFWRNELRNLNHNNVFFYHAMNWGGLYDAAGDNPGISERILTSVRLYKPCFLLGGYFINWDGQAYLCTAHPMPYMVIGNVRDMSPDKFGESPLLKKYHDAHREGNFNIPGCRDCTVNTTVPLKLIQKKIISSLCRLF